MRTLSLSIALGLFATMPVTAAGLPQQPDGAAKTPPAEAPSPAPPSTVKIGSVAELRLSDGWTYLDGKEGQTFLEQLGNPPDDSVLGVAVSPDHEETGVFSVFFYEDDGHVDDEETPDYDELLAQMQASAEEEGKARRKAGFEGLKLLGWAEPPHYDRATHKLYWAERLLFDGTEGETLNYNVRVLGRTGHLIVRGVGSVELLPVVAAHQQRLLENTDFVAGKRYEDFDPAYDKVAAYGIGALIAGKVAAKAGLLKLLIKPFVVLVAVVGGYVARLFGRKKRQDAPPAPAA